jgi:hypothetical protein
MDLIHKNVQVAGACSSRRRVFAVLGLLEILVLIVLISACGKSSGEGNAPSQSVMTSSGASGSAGEGDAPSQSGMTSSGAPIGGDQVPPPSAAAAPAGDPTNGFTRIPIPISPPPPSKSPCPTPESPGQACQITTPPTPVGEAPVGEAPVQPTPAPASGLARAFFGFTGRLM